MTGRPNPRPGLAAHLRRWRSITPGAPAKTRDVPAAVWVLPGGTVALEVLADGRCHLWVGHAALVAQFTPAASDQLVAACARHATSSALVAS